MLAATALLAMPTFAQPSEGAPGADQTDTRVISGNTTGSGADAPTIEPLAPDWTIRLEPFVGYLAPAGDIRLPAATTRGDKIELTDLNLDSPRLAPIGRIQAKRDKWRIMFTGLGFNADDRGATPGIAGQIGGVAFAPGDTLTSDLSYEAFDLMIGYRVWEHTSETNDAGRTRLVAGLDLLGGVRFHHADFDVRNAPALAPAPGTILGASADEFFAEPIVGARFDLMIHEQFGLEVESTAGGFGFDDRSSVSFSIDAGFAYRPVHWAGVKIGYRLLVFGLQDGDGADEFEWSGSMAGLYFGAQFSF